MVKLKALKDGRYGTRRLKAGDEFDAAPPYDRVWIAMGWAEKIDQPAVSVPPATRQVPPPPADPELERLRQVHEDLVGPVDGRWSKATLQEKLAAAQAEADKQSSPPESVSD